MWNEGSDGETAAELTVSDAVAMRAGVDLLRLPHHLIELRGRREPLALRTIDNAAQFPEAAP